MTQYTKFTPTPNGLLIELTDQGKEAAADFLERLEKENYFIIWHELNEYEFCNGWHPVEAQDIAALTSASLISDTYIDSQSTKKERESAKIFWFYQYETRDELRELLTNGSVLFTLAT